MYCDKCGSSINENKKYCSNCGNYVQNNYNVNVKFEESGRPNNKLAKTSIFIGVLSLCLVFIFQVFTIPLSTIGIIFGVKAFKKTKEKTGIWLNTISLLLAVPVLLIYGFVLNPVNDVLGTWNCKYFNNGNFEELDYALTLTIKRDNSFVWSVYGDEEKNYLEGNLTVKKLNKKVSNAQYYSLVLNGSKYVVDGILQNKGQKTEYEMALDTVSKNEAFLMNAYSYNMYACFKDNK